MSGTPCFRGTRVPIQTLIDHWEGGSTIEEFLEDFPTVTRAQAVRFIELAKERMVSCAPVANRRWTACFATVARRVTNSPQVTNLPHKPTPSVTAFREPQ